jgi:hypothetical protein
MRLRAIEHADICILDYWCHCGFEGQDQSIFVSWKQKRVVILWLTNGICKKNHVNPWLRRENQELMPFYFFCIGFDQTTFIKSIRSYSLRRQQNVHI